MFLNSGKVKKYLLYAIGEVATITVLKEGLVPT